MKNSSSLLRGTAQWTVSILCEKFYCGLLSRNRKSQKKKEQTNNGRKEYTCSALYKGIFRGMMSGLRVYEVDGTGKGIAEQCNFICQSMEPWEGPGTHMLYTAWHARRRAHFSDAADEAEDRNWDGTSDSLSHNSEVDKAFFLNSSFQKFISTHNNFIPNVGSSKKQKSFRKTSTSVLLFQKNIYFCFIDYAKAFDCVYLSQQTVGNSSRDGNTRWPDLPLEKSVCR